MPNRPDPPTQVRQFLTVARRQRVPFDEAWRDALWRTKFHGWKPLRDSYRAALEETRWAFERAYNREDVPGGPALLVLAEIIATKDADDGGTAAVGKHDLALRGSRAA